jgi:hypothetical protein
MSNLPKVSGLYRMLRDNKPTAYGADGGQSLSLMELQRRRGQPNDTPTSEGEEEKEDEEEVDGVGEQINEQRIEDNDDTIPDMPEPTPAPNIASEPT